MRFEIGISRFAHLWSIVTFVSPGLYGGRLRFNHRVASILLLIKLAGLRWWKKGPRYELLSPLYPLKQQGVLI